MTDPNRISDDQHNNAPAVPQGWVKASDRMPLDGYSDGLREIADELDAVQKDLAGIELQADGNANFYWLMRDGKWIAKIQMNGEMLVDKQVALLEAMLSAGTQIAHCPKCFTCFEVGSGSTEQNPWRDAVIEQLESWHICVPAIHDNSPRLAIKALVNIETKAALDPAVSSEAAALVAGQHNNAPAVPQGWTKAADQVPLEADGEVFIRFTDGSIGTGWATYWHGASNEFAQWTFPDPDEDRTVLEWTKNPATPAPAPAVPQSDPTEEMLVAGLKECEPLGELIDWREGFGRSEMRAVWEAMLAATPAPAPTQGEPFGYFRVEPFGWTDCAKDDEGAVALYERPQESELRKELDSANDFIKSLADLIQKYEKMLGYRTTNAPEGAYALAEAKGESSLNTELDLACADFTCQHDFALDPKSSIRICLKCGTPERLAKKTAAPAQEPETALQKFTRFKVAETEGNPVEMLRAFCAFAMNSQDWFDVEPFFDLVREAMASRTAVAPAQEVATLSLAAEDVHAAFTKNFPKSRISQAWINFAADIAQAIAARAAKHAQDAGLTDARLLDWLERQHLEELCMGVVIDAPHDGEYYVNGDDGVTYYGKTLREALKKALRAKGASDA